jgi:transcriptional regulator with XRE-family HTH domain
MDAESGVTVNQRVKVIRKTLKLTQHDFGKILALSQGQITGIETKQGGVTDRTIKLICDSFNANPQWLRTGEGDMFVQKDDAKLKKLLALFTNLQPQYQNFIFHAMDLFLKMQDEKDTEMRQREEYQTR